MQIEAQLQVKHKEFSDFIFSMVKQDINTSTNTATEVIESGFQYKKDILSYMQKKESVFVTIDILCEGKYQATFESAQGKNSIAYSYEEASDGLLHVSYVEDYFAVNTSTQLSHKFMAMITNRKNKKRAEALLKQIEGIIIEQRREEKA